MTTGTPAPPGANRDENDTVNIGAALRELALHERAPAELDRLLEPLRLQDSQPPLVRPALRWAALAAAAVAVVVWWPSGDAGPKPEHAPRMAAVHRTPGYFQLQPLPTADPDELPGTAAEALQRLEPTAPLPTPAPLNVIGPTEEDPSGTGAVRSCRLIVAGTVHEILLPDTVPEQPLKLLLTVRGGHIVSANTTGGGPVPRSLLEALAPVELNAPDGTVRAHLEPATSSPKTTP
ncbi:MAG TPA: hypothetical protein ENK19_09310 [Acidobacteria bacterium]|nr:hypothetical protein [Acidobacteriota bacterium]